MFWESHLGHLRVCSWGLADVDFRVPELWLFSSLFAADDFAAMLTGAMLMVSTSPGAKLP